MATLIQSKQIEGVVTASVIEGTFTVQSGSVNLSGASGVTGSFSGSFIGDGSQLTFGGTNLFSGSIIGQGNITITSGSGNITISGSGGSGASSWSELSGIPSGLVSSSQTLSFNQVSKQLTISDGNSVDLSSLGGGGGGGSSIWTTGSNFYKVSSDLQVTGSFSATSLTGSIDYSNLTNVPSGLISGSSQITITESQISDLSHYTNTDVLTYINSIGVVSGSVVADLPSGVVSSSAQITDGSGIVSGSVLRTLGGTNVLSASVTFEQYSSSVATTIDNIQHTQIPSGVISGSTFTTFSSSVDSRLTTLEGATDNTGSDTQTLSISGDQLTISSGNTITIPTGSTGTSDFTELINVPSGLVSSSTQITDGSGIISGSVLRTLDGTGVVSGSVLRTLGGTNVLSSSTDFQTYSSSVDSRILTEKSRIDNILSGANADYDQFVEIVNLVNSTDTENDTAFANHYTSSRQRLTSLENFTQSIDTTIKTKLNTDDVLSGSIESLLPSGLVSGSTQITDGSNIVSGSVLRTLDGTGVVSGSVLRTLDGTGVVSGSVLRTLDGTGVLSGSHTDITSLNQFSSSVQSQVDSLIAATSSYLTSETDSQTLSISGDQLTISNGNTVTIPTGSNLPSGVISSSAQISSLGYVTSSNEAPFDGNRVISNEDLGDLFTNSVNPGTSGSLADFIEAVFYPNTGPSISTGNQTISEYTSNGTTIVTLSGTDPEGQSITWGTGSSYTDDLVRVSSGGVLSLNTLAESSSFNTDSVGSGHGHLVVVKATDTFGTSTEKDIYIIVTPNEAPKFRQTSVGGSVITSFTANLNENSTNGTVVGTIYFTDAESDSITIYSSSIDNNHFVVNKYSTYVQIVQNTGSLDYEQQTSYSFSISASDEHYEAGQDLDSITSLPITINVTDNQIPVVNNQTLSSINENSSNGATVDSIAASDNEGDTITFVNFNLHKLLLDGVEVSSGSYGGTSQLTDPTENPFQMNSSGVVTRKSGVYLNSDLINSYQYRVQVKDDFNTSSPASIITIPITDDTPATLSDNWSAGPYIKESELSGTTIKTTNYGSTQADYGSTQGGTWSSSNSAITIHPTFGTLSLGVNLSGSVTQSGDTLDSTITFTNSFGTTTTDNLSVTIVDNSAPFATFVQQSSNLNTNLATNGTNLETVSISDDESDTPYSLTIGGTNASSLNAVPQNAASSSWQIHANGNLSAGTYNYNVTVRDSYSKQTTYTGRSITITQASTGTLSTNGTLYVIESATNGDNIVLNSNGRTGTQGSVSVSYSPNYGSQSAGSFTSSNGLVLINSSTGVLSVGTDISGSGNVNGDTITSTIGWTDQYGNVGSDTITVNVAKNNAPSVSSTQTFNTNTNQATGSSEIVRLNLSDTEGDTIPNSSLSFTDYNSTYFTPSISTPQMKLLVNSTSIPAGSYPYTASIEDEHGFETRVHSGSVTIIQAGNGTLSGDTAIYIIESAENGSVFRDQTGFNQGSPAQLTVSYGSPNYGSAVVQSYTSSNEAIVVDSSGNLTLGVDISGSVTQSGDTFTSTITFRDQYDNVGTGNVTATVFGNSSPAASFTATSNYNTDGATSGSTAGTLTVTDTESNSPFSVTLAGTDGGKFDVQGSSSPFTIQPTGSLSAGTYTINITVTDSYSESVTLTGETITVSSANDYGKVYIYTSTRTGGGTLSNDNYDGLMGITSENTTFEPDLITGYQSVGPSPIYAFKTGYLGSGSVTVGGGTMTLRNTVSGSNLDTIISSSFNGNGSTAEQIMIIFPSGSDMDGIPTSMTDSLGGSTNGEYVLYLKAAGESSFTVAGTQIHMFDVDSAVEGFTRWNIIGRNSVNTAASYEVRLIPSSGSAP